MNLFIRDVKMPDNCHECACFNYEHYICQATGKTPFENVAQWRASDCPLSDFSPNGEWIHVTGGSQKCSVCKSIFYNPDEDVFWYFCPHCGSHMTYGLLQNPD